MMTTMALIAGSLPIAIGFNEASKQRTSMGVAIVGGLISSTLLTLVVVPAAYSYIDRFREFMARILAQLFMSKEALEEMQPTPQVPLPPTGNGSGGTGGFASHAPGAPKED
jgi:hypothetical protein